MERSSFFRSPVPFLCFIFVTFLFCRFSYASVQAQERNSFTDNIIGSTFKTLAKAFVSTVDLEKLKKENIEKLNKMDEIKFRKHYMRLYKVIKDCPLVRDSYGLNEGLTRDEAVGKINSLERIKIYEILDSIPNSFIASQFRLYLSERKQEIQKSNIMLQIREFWGRMILRARAK